MTTYRARRPQLIDWGEIIHDYIGDFRFWIGSVWGVMAFLFFIADLSVAIGYMVGFSVFSGKGTYLAVLGGLIAIGVGFWVHLGVHRSFTFFRSWVLRGISLLATAGVLVLAFNIASTMQLDLYEEDVADEKVRLQEAGGQRDIAQLERDTAARDAARSAYVTASERRARAEQWQSQVIDCRQAQAAGGGPCPDVTAIQAALNIRQDGIVRTQTADAVATEVEEARRAESEANAKYQQAIAAHTAAAGSAEERAAKATELEAETSYLTTIRGKVEDRLGIAYVHYPSTPEEIANNEVISKTAEQWAKWWAAGFGLFITAGSFILGLFRFSVKDQPYVAPEMPDHGDTLDVDRSGRLLMGPGGGSVADDGDMQVDRSGRRIYVADDAPRQPGESASAARERLQRAYKALERASAVDDSEDEVFIAEEAALVEEIARRKKASAQEQRHRARLAALERQLKETEMASRPVPGLDALDAMKRRLAEMDGANGMATPRPEPEIAARANGVGDDLRRRLALEAEFRRLDQEWRSPVTTPGRKDAIEARMHEIHAELVPIMQRLEEIARTG